MRYCAKLRTMVNEWNESHTAHFVWFPRRSELEKLFRGGDPLHRRQLCYEAINLLGEHVTYADVVLRAVGLMLKAGQRARIVNPLGWLWSCLHGNGEGGAPWVQLVTREEEQARQAEAASQEAKR